MGVQELPRPVDGHEKKAALKQSASCGVSPASGAVCSVAESSWTNDKINVLQILSYHQEGGVVEGEQEPQEVYSLKVESL